MMLRLVRSTMMGILAVFLAWGAQAQQPAADAVGAVIEKLGVAMIGTMRDAKQLGYQGRFQKLAPTIIEAFDLPKMISIAAGVLFLLSPAWAGGARASMLLREEAGFELAGQKLLAPQRAECQLFAARNQRAKVSVELVLSRARSLQGWGRSGSCSRRRRSTCCCSSRWIARWS